MSASTPENAKCVKQGMVLTCYVDGRKRFRAISVSTEGSGAAPAATDPDTRSRKTPTKSRISASVPTRRHGR